MATQNADALALKVGEIPVLQTPEGNRPISKSPLPEAHFLGYLRELAGAEDIHLLERREPFAFPYRTFRVQVEFPPSGACAWIRPAPESSPLGDLPAFPGGAVLPAETAGEPQAAESSPSAGEDEERFVAAAPRGMPTDKPFVPGVSHGQNAIDPLFYELIERKGSDLHLTCTEPPRMRLHGEMVRTDHPVITPDRMRELLWPILPEKGRKEFETDRDTDFAYEIAGLARFRCNYFMDRFGMGAVFRQIPTKIPTVEELGLPKHVVDLCWLSKGFVVVTGPTGSGKSTTLSALVDYINQHRTDHIITIEDPIEFVHPHKKCLINQREVGEHTMSFKRALRAALREDPDICLVGEMRDLETIAIAIETSETGHLVFGTLHTTTAASTVDRIIDQFPADRQAQIRVMLSETLKGIIAQTLCKKIGGGRIAAFEILLVNSAIANLIREGKTFQIPSIMQTQKGIGNICLNDSLLEVVRKGLVDPKEAYIKAVDKVSLKALYERNGIKFDLEKEV
jgi:twitching motility protein PilT